MFQTLVFPVTAVPCYNTMAGKHTPTLLLLLLTTYYLHIRIVVHHTISCPNRNMLPKPKSQFPSRRKSGKTVKHPRTAIHTYRIWTPWSLCINKEPQDLLRNNHSKRKENRTTQTHPTERKRSTSKNRHLLSVILPFAQIPKTCCVAARGPATNNHWCALIYSTTGIINTGTWCVMYRSVSLLQPYTYQIHAQTLNYLSNTTFFDLANNFEVCGERGREKNHIRVFCVYSVCSCSRVILKVEIR